MRDIIFLKRVNNICPKIKFDFEFWTSTGSNICYLIINLFFPYIGGANQHLLGRYCNTSSPAPVTSSSYVATIHFHSDGSLSDTGFLITWTSVPGKILSTTYLVGN